jgi:hypothetical protein
VTAADPAAVPVLSTAPAPAEPPAPAAAVVVVRPYAVCNGYGEHLHAFTQWEIAHAWAHRHLHDPDMILPLEIEDRAQRITTRISRERCELITWTVFTKDPCCGTRQARIPPYLPDPPTPAVPPRPASGRQRVARVGPPR